MTLEPPTPVATFTPRTACTGDCNEDRVVTVDELVHAVSISLELPGVPGCVGLDLDKDGHVSTDEVVDAVDAALSRCE